MQIILQDLINSLTPDDILKIMKNLGAEKRGEKEGDYFVFPTICHNINSEDASSKLYYYFSTKLFHCYTDCGESFNIIGLIKKVFKIRGQTYSLRDIINFICATTNYKQLYDLSINKYKSVASKYKKIIREKPIKIYNKEILSIFSHEYPIEWLEEGITSKTMDKFNILYSISRNKIIIPHYDINNNLIGIRGRALDEIEMQEYGKYAPIQIEGVLYSHPLSQNLYGLNIAKNAIQKERKIIIAEAEKSAMLSYTMFGEDSICVAVCGSNLNKMQIDIILKNFNVNEVIIALDKEYDNFWDINGRKYLSKIEKICNKYKNYFNFSFIYDKNNLLDKKDSPFDKGKETFLKLYQSRIKVIN